MKRMVKFFTLIVSLLLLAMPVLAQSGETPMTRFLEANGAVTCEASPGFQCVDITVPLDHTNPDNGETIDISFAVIPAGNPEARRGMFVTVVGGPGYSGLYAADVYSSYFYPEVFENFDVVFFDQRGIGQSEGVRCDDAALAYYLADTADQEALLDAAETFATGCMAAIDRPDLLPYLGTTQAVEDLELFRQAVGDEQFWLYGESYGTQFSQTYTAAYPERVAGLILDGVVDLTLEGADFYAGQDAAFENATTESLLACADDPACAAEFPDGAPDVFFSNFQAQLADTPITVDFVLADGTLAQRELSDPLLNAALYDAMYTEFGRAVFVRELAAAANGNYVPLLRHAYSALFLNPETLELEPDPSWSDGAYYAIDCSDYVYSLEQSDPVCPFWTLAQPPQERPAPLTAGVPTLILNATLDPATPVQNGYDVAARLPDAYSITMEGGPHVIYGRGGTCPDDQVTAFLVSGEVPAARESFCDGVIMTDYIPVLPVELTNVAEVLTRFDQNRESAPQYLYWDVVTPFAMGCDFGGTVSYEAADAGEMMTFDACGFVPNVFVTGTGMLDYDTGIFTLNATLSGELSGDVVFTRVGLYATDAVNPEVEVTSGS
ncbi:MAG: putative hydrolase [Chloroflexi bacterium OLB15]|nr:MAG: putative hydrolase [Chloroflexi bacterium OLB15]